MLLRFRLLVSTALLSLLLGGCGTAAEADPTPDWQGETTRLPGSGNDGDGAADGDPDTSDPASVAQAAIDEGPDDLPLDTSVVDTGGPDSTVDGPFAASGSTQNLFTELLGVSEAEVDAKLEQAVNRVFGIGTGESTTPEQNQGYRLYYELPQDSSMAFIWAADSQDIRSEGMSYGMMIAVQMGMQRQFDRLWKFAQTFMQFPGDSGVTSWRYYFKWQGRVNTQNASSWPVSYGNGTGPAPDGEEYFAAALYLADLRWGSQGGVDYRRHADDLTGAMLNNPRAQSRTPVFNPDRNLVVFYPNGGTANFSDPSYHLPAFYDLFAQEGPPEDRDRWRQIAGLSRDFLVRSAHPDTGLHPDYANFDGSPNSGGSNHDRFMFDAWRVVMNMGIDYAWFSRDERMREQVNKYHAFFFTRLNGNNVQNQIYDLNGGNGSDGGSTALTATLAAGALASSFPDRARFVENLWTIRQQQGLYRYYQESVYLLGLLATAGRMRHDFSPAP